jgi:hypothetical protein
MLRNKERVILKFPRHNKITTKVFVWWRERSKNAFFFVRPQLMSLFAIQPDITKTITRDVYSTCAFNKKLKSRRTIYCLSEWVAWKGIKKKWKKARPCNWKIFACIPHKTAIPSVIKLGEAFIPVPFIALLRHVFHFPISTRAPLRAPR